MSTARRFAQERFDEAVTAFRLRPTRNNALKVEVARDRLEEIIWRETPAPIATAETLAIGVADRPGE